MGEEAISESPGISKDAKKSNIIIIIIIIIIISVMELGHLLTRSGLTHPEVSLTVYHDFFCQLGNIVS